MERLAGIACEPSVCVSVLTDPDYDVFHRPSKEHMFGRRKRKRQAILDAGDPFAKNGSLVTATGLEPYVYDADVRFIPTSLLIDMIDPGTYSNLVRLETEYLTDLVAQIASDGLREALVLAVDPHGVAIKDGHHRAACAVWLEMDMLPCRLRFVPHIRRHKLPIEDFIGFLWGETRQVGGGIPPLF